AAGGLLQASLAVGTDHSQAPLMDVLPLTLSSRSLIPRLAYRHSTAHTDVEIGVDGELQRFAPLTPIMRPGTLDLASARDAPVGRLRIADRARRPAGGDARAASGQLRRQRHGTGGPGPAAERAPGAGRSHVSHGGGRKIHADTQPGAAGTGRGELRPGAVRA